MTMPIVSAPSTGRLLGVLAAMSLSACAAQSPADQPTTRYDGIYTGAQTPDAGEQGCGSGVHSVRFEVAGNHIWIHTHHRRRSLDGNVDPGGQVAMRDGNGTRTINGTIVGDRLIGVESTTRSARKHTSLLDSYQESGCTTRIDATRATASAAAADPSD